MFCFNSFVKNNIKFKIKISLKTIYSSVIVNYNREIFDLIESDRHSSYFLTHIFPENRFTIFVMLSNYKKIEILYVII